VFAIDKNPATADIDAAVRYAHTRGAWTLGVTEKTDRDYLTGYGVK